MAKTKLGFRITKKKTKIKRLKQFPSDRDHVEPSKNMPVINDVRHDGR